MATNNSGFNSAYMFACLLQVKSDGREKEAERHRARTEGGRGFMWKIYAACETFFPIAEADRVLCHLVMFLPVFLHWIYKIK